MSKLDDLIKGCKNVPNDNFDYDKAKFKDLMLEQIKAKEFKFLDTPLMVLNSEELQEWIQEL